MKIISHRGNLIESNSIRENSVDYIEEAIAEGFDVEIDLWVDGDQYYLGHDNPQYFVSIEWLKKCKDVLWIHCKNREALEKLSTSMVEFNYFWHESDRYTITSKGFGWILVGQFPYSKGIIVLPETTNYYDVPENLQKGFGICTDKPLFYQKELGVKNEVGN